MSTAKQIRLWEDGTYSEGGGHWIAVRLEEWEEMRDVIASARSVERSRRLTGHPSVAKWLLLGARIKKMDNNIAKAKANQ